MEGAIPRSGVGGRGAAEEALNIIAGLNRKFHIDQYQKVDVVNLNTGNRWSTYVIKGDQGVFELNGGGARLGEIGDPCVILSYTTTPHFEGATVIHTDKYNKISKKTKKTIKKTLLVTTMWGALIFTLAIMFVIDVPWAVI